MIVSRFADDSQELVHVWIPISEVGADVDQLTPRLCEAAVEMWGDLRPAEFEALPPTLSLQPETGRPSWKFGLTRRPLQGCPLCEGRGHVGQVTTGE